MHYELTLDDLNFRYEKYDIYILVHAVEDEAIYFLIKKLMFGISLTL